MVRIKAYASGVLPSLKYPPWSFVLTAASPDKPKMSKGSQ